ncbi:hypothetical protein BDY21DRAFT_422208 [Lineolata rhizophorae]|uniref:Uncharacterized protein n=1 Tax=Lineolata rhizophorae TaxID=578093 RepID=A0A6A6NX95_9PEZI|nr:hypothetical protein BDY21DRAFT_422208 [Lineolata rhizophorae]
MYDSSSHVTIGAKGCRPRSSAQRYEPGPALKYTVVDRIVTVYVRCTSLLFEFDRDRGGCHEPNAMGMVYHRLEPYMKYMITTTVPYDVANIVMKCDTAVEMYHTVVNIYSKESYRTVVKEAYQFMDLRAKDRKDVTDLCVRFSGLYNSFKKICDMPDHVRKSIWWLWKLRDQYPTEVDQYLHMDNLEHRLPLFETLVREFTICEEQQRSKKNFTVKSQTSTDQNQKVSCGNSNCKKSHKLPPENKSKGRLLHLFCHHCKCLGHTEEKCFTKHPELLEALRKKKPKKGDSKDQSQSNTEGSGNLSPAAMYYKRDNSDDSDTVCDDVDDRVPTSFILDSGSNTHIVGSRRFVKDLTNVTIYYNHVDGSVDLPVIVARQIGLQPNGVDLSAVMVSVEVEGAVAVVAIEVVRATIGSGIPLRNCFKALIS